jgi:hypothetical protein
LGELKREYAARKKELTLRMLGNSTEPIYEKRTQVKKEKLNFDVTI